MKRTRRARDHRRAAKLRRYSAETWKQALRDAEHRLMDELFAGVTALRGMPALRRPTESIQINDVPAFIDYDFKEGYLRQALMPGMIDCDGIDSMRMEAARKIAEFLIREEAITCTMDRESRSGPLLLEWRVYIAKPAPLRRMPIPERTAP